MNIYDLENCKNSKYKYADDAIKQINRIKKTEKISNIIVNCLIIVLLLNHFMFQSLIPTIFLIYVTIIVYVGLKFIQYKLNNIIKDQLIKKNYKAYHDFVYYFYCESKDKEDIAVNLLDLTYSNIKMKRYKEALKTLEKIDIQQNYNEFDEFLYYSYYSKVYKELGYIYEAEDYFIHLEKICNNNKLTEKEKQIFDELALIKK